MKIAGIDPSINSTGKVIMDLDDDLNIKNIEFYGYTTGITKGFEKNNVHIYPLCRNYEKMQILERQDVAYNILNKDMDDVKFISFEEYAFSKGSSGRVFQIGEFCGGLKRFFYDQGKGIVVYGINQIKRFATGNGNADKIMMCQSFKEEWESIYPELFDNWPTYNFKQYESPHSDLCDAFWMCEILRNHIKYDILGESSLDSNQIKLLTCSTTKKSKALISHDVIIKKV